MRLCGLTAIGIFDRAVRPAVSFLLGPVFPFEHLRWMASVMCLPYALIWVARYAPLSFPVKSDYSYGVYLSAWPIQQAATHLAKVNSVTLPAFGMFAIGLSGSLLCALASWHLLEKHAIRLSHYVPSSHSD